MRHSRLNAASEPARESRSARIRSLAVAISVLAATALGGAAAHGQDLESRVQDKREAVEQASAQRGVLSSEIADYSTQIDSLIGQVAQLRNREAIVQEELDSAEVRLEAEQQNLEILRKRLDRSVELLRDRLVDIYKSDDPSVLTVLLESDGYEDLLGHYEYLERLQNQDSDIVEQVRGLRDDARDTVDRVRTTRDSIAAKRAELERTRLALESREAELQQARSQSRQALTSIDGRVSRLEGDIAGLEKKIQAELAAAQAEAAEAAAPAPLPAGPIQGGSGAMIWPINGTVTSPFGERWGRLHAGLDIAAPGGTPIRAADDGTIVLSQSEAESGGYGNYTCVDHGGGLSSCYAHQSSFELTSGSVSQGDVIGYVGNTGNSFGDHLHFEVRLNGTPTDPMGYL